MKTAVIFDFDGVVVDSERYWPDLGRRIFMQVSDGPFTDADHRKFTGNSLSNCYDIMVREYGLQMPIADYDQIVTVCAREVYDTVVQPMPSVMQFIELLAARRMPTAIASSNKRDFVVNTTQRLDLEKHFPIIVTGDDVPHDRAKPHPDIYLLAAERLGMAAAGCIAIEDSPTGIAAAKNAGMHCIALHTDHNALQDLSAADTHVTSFDELSIDALASLAA